jgi:hypothetical protein
VQWPGRSGVSSFGNSDKEHFRNSLNFTANPLTSLFSDTP